MARMVIKNGEKFNKLTVIKEVDPYMTTCRGYAHAMRQFLCLCDCGKESIVRMSSLTTGKTKSCGCIVNKHNMTHTPTYESWCAMRQRCNNKNNPAYKRYGGREIKVCTRWNNSFENFIEDMGERPEDRTLDRIDNSKGYSKENCRWATYTEQNNNTRRNKYITYKGKKMTIPQWARHLNIKRSTLSQRYYVYHWDIEKCLTQ